MQHPFLDSKHLYKSQFPWLTDYYPQNQGFGSGSNLSWQNGSRSMIFSWSDPDPGKNSKDPDASVFCLRFWFGIRMMLELDPDPENFENRIRTKTTLRMSCQRDQKILKQSSLLWIHFWLCSVVLWIFCGHLSFIKVF